MPVFLTYSALFSLSPCFDIFYCLFSFVFNIAKTLSFLKYVYESKNLASTVFLLIFYLFDV